MATDMSASEALSENLKSLFGEYKHLMNSNSDPDIGDLRDICVGLCVSLDIAREQDATDAHIMELVMTFLRPAYGVGIARGRNQDKALPVKRSRSNNKLVTWWWVVFLFAVWSDIISGGAVPRGAFMLSSFAALLGVVHLIRRGK